MPLTLAQATLAGAGISAGSNLLGGLFGSSEAKKSRKMAKRQFAAQMDESIQRRVADAKKAGVHPLFALGASVGASPTSQSFGTPMGDAVAAAGDAVGQGISGAAAARANAKRQDLLLNSQLERDRAAMENDYAQAGLYEAQTARVNQELMSVGRDQQALQDSGLAETIPPAKRMKGTDYEVGNLYKMYLDPDTGNYVRLPHPELNADEIVQLQLAGYFTKKEAQAGIARLKGVVRKARVKAADAEGKVRHPRGRRRGQGARYTR